MAPRQGLVAISAVQFAVQLLGLAVALRRGRNYDVGFMRGSPERIRHDAIWSGTAYSAPVPMLATQLWAIRRLRARPDDASRRVLGLLGVLYVPGYLAERYVRGHLRRGGLDPVETPIAIASIGLAAAMGALGHRDQAGR